MDSRVPCEGCPYSCPSEELHDVGEGEKPGVDADENDWRVDGVRETALSRVCVWVTSPARLGVSLATFGEAEKTPSLSALMVE